MTKCTTPPLNYLAPLLVEFESTRHQGLAVIGGSDALSSWLVFSGLDDRLVASVRRLRPLHRAVDVAVSNINEQNEAGVVDLACGERQAVRAIARVGAW